MHLAYDYLDKKNIPYRKCGKLIVATNKTEQSNLANLHDRGILNKVPDLKLIKGEKAIKEIEPHCTGLEALWSPHTGIVDWGLVTEYFGRDFVETGGKIYLNSEVGFYHCLKQLMLVLYSLRFTR